MKDKNIEYMLELLKLPSVTGDTDEGINYIENVFKALGVKEITRTIKNSLIATIRGKNDDIHRTLSAHVDTLGLMIKRIENDGKIRVSNIGGFTAPTIENENCIIKTYDNKIYTGTIIPDHSSAHAYTSKGVGDFKRDFDSVYVRLDEIIKNKEDVLKLGINVGDFVSLDTKTILTENGFIKSRHLDDKACVGMFFEVLDRIITENIVPEYTTHFYITTYEEEGHGCSEGTPHKTKEFVAVDMAVVSDINVSDELCVTICAKDTSGPYDYNLRKKLQKIAIDNNIEHKIDVYNYYSSDASAALKAGTPIIHGLIGPGIHTSHSYERAHLKGLDNSIELIMKYIQTK